MDVIVLGGCGITQHMRRKIRCILLAAEMTTAFASETTEHTFNDLDYEIQDNADAEEPYYETHDFIIPRRHHSDYFGIGLSIP